MKFQNALIVTIAVVAATCGAVQAGAGTSSAIRVSGTYTVDAKAKTKDSCKPLSKANAAVLRCTVTGFVLDYTGSLEGRGVNTFRWIINCKTGKSYTDGTETFTGSIAGRSSGTATWGVRSTGMFDCKKGAVTSISAFQNLYSGTGAFAGLYGSMHRGPGKYSGVLSS